jgi:hypothetical protein
MEQMTLSQLYLYSLLLLLLLLLHDERLINCDQPNIHTRWRTLTSTFSF